MGHDSVSFQEDHAMASSSGAGELCRTAHRVDSSLFWLILMERSRRWLRAPIGSSFGLFYNLDSIISIIYSISFVLCIFTYIKLRRRLRHIVEVFGRSKIFRQSLFDETHKLIRIGSTKNHGWFHDQNIVMGAVDASQDAILCL